MTRVVGVKNELLGFMCCCIKENVLWYRQMKYISVTLGLYIYQPQGKVVEEIV